MTADCLPVLFTTTSGTEVAAAHAGWRGLMRWRIRRNYQILQAKPEDIIAWFGPAIGPTAFQVGIDVVKQFFAVDEKAKTRLST